MQNSCSKGESARPTCFRLLETTSVASLHCCEALFPPHLQQQQHMQPLHGYPMTQHPSIPATLLPEHHPHFQQQFAPQRFPGSAPSQAGVPATMLPEQMPHRLAQPNAPAKQPGVPATMLPADHRDHQYAPMQTHQPQRYPAQQQPTVPATLLPEQIPMPHGMMPMGPGPGQPLHELQPPFLDHRLQEILKPEPRPDQLPNRDSIQIYQLPPQGSQGGQVPPTQPQNFQLPQQMQVAWLPRVNVGALVIRTGFWGHIIL